MKKLLNTLYIFTPGKRLSLAGETVVIKDGGTVVSTVPLISLESILICGGGATPELMGKCASDGIALTFLNRHGKFLARVQGAVNGNVLLRRQQYRIADDAQESLKIARNMILGKLFNSRWTLERTIRDHGLRIQTERFREKSDYLKNNIKRLSEIESLDSLRGLEGESAVSYFSVFDDMILQQKEQFYFKNRNKRPPQDNVNALLSFAYSLMTSMCSSALESVGLDPYVGFLHTDRPGRASLALDLVEEFRSSFCDRFVLTLINKKIIGDSDFMQEEDGAVLLTDEGRMKFIQSWQKRKLETLTHPFLEEKVQWGLVPYVQALLLARYIRGDLDEYPPFLWK